MISSELQEVSRACSVLAVLQMYVNNYMYIDYFAFLLRSQIVLNDLFRYFFASFL